jgi:hypothetical protein
MNRDCASNVTLIVDVSHSQYGSLPRQSASVVIFCWTRDLHLAGWDACRRHRAAAVCGPKGFYTGCSFVYDGRTQDDGEFGDIHILSIPAIEWFQVEVETGSRIVHAYAVIRHRQIVSAGGVEKVWDWVDAGSVVQRDWHFPYDRVEMDRQIP